MEHIFEKIFNNVLVHEKKCIKNISLVDKETIKLLEKYRRKLNNTDFEELQSDIFSLSLTAEHAGFKTGIEFMFSLMNAKEF